MRPNAFWAEKTLIRTNLQWRSAVRTSPPTHPPGRAARSPGGQTHSPHVVDRTHQKTRRIPTSNPLCPPAQSNGVDRVARQKC